MTKASDARDRAKIITNKTYFTVEDRAYMQGFADVRALPPGAAAASAAGLARGAADTLARTSTTPSSTDPSTSPALFVGQYTREAITVADCEKVRTVAYPGRE